MAKKDFDEYVLKMAKQCDDFKKVLESISSEAQDNLVDLDYIDRVEQQKAKIEENYQRLLFIKFLLDQPTKKKKIKKYNNQLKSALKKLNKSNSLDSVLEENNTIIEELKKK